MIPRRLTWPCICATGSTTTRRLRAPRGATKSGASITLRGYDTVLCEEVAANHFYYAEDGGIVEGRRFSDANTRASMASLEYGLQGGKRKMLTSIFDYDRLDELV